jgi:hypothetical protein
MTDQPAADLRFGGSEPAVDQQVDVQAPRRLPVERLQERAELEPAPSLLVGGDRPLLAGGEAARAGPLVHGERQRPLRQVEVEPDEVGDLVDEPHPGVRSERFGRSPGLEPVRLPHPLDRGLADADLAREAPRRPEGAAAGPSAERAAQDHLDLRRGDRRRPARARRVPLDPREPLHEVPSPPPRGGPRIGAEPRGDLPVGKSVRREQHDPGPLGEAGGRRRRARERGEAGPLATQQSNLGGAAHDRPTPCEVITWRSYGSTRLLIRPAPLVLLTRTLGPPPDPRGSASLLLPTRVPSRKGRPSARPPVFRPWWRRSRGARASTEVGAPGPGSGGDLRERGP